MRRRFLKDGSGLGSALVRPGPACRGSGPDGPDPRRRLSPRVNTTWVIVAGVLVMFMQAGFAFLEIGFSRAKNAGTGIAKILTNFSIASICYWAVGFALAFGGAGTIAGDHGFFLDVSSVPSEAAKQFPFLAT